MTTYIQNYGFTKTTINNNNQKINNEIQWKGDYDGDTANIDVKINDNGNKEFVSLQLTNNDLINLFGMKPIDMPLDERLNIDFLLDDVSMKSYDPIVLEGALIPNPKVKSNKKQNKKSRKYRRHKRRQIYSRHI